MIGIPNAVVRLLLELETRGVRALLDWDTQELLLEPASLVTDAERQFIDMHYDATLTAVAIATDAGVHARRYAFYGRTDSNLLVPDAPYQPGRCISCGTKSRPAGRRPTRCWRCAVAWSVAVEDRRR